MNTRKVWVQMIVEISFLSSHCVWMNTADDVYKTTCDLNIDSSILSCHYYMILYYLPFIYLFFNFFACQYTSNYMRRPVSAKIVDSKGSSTVHVFYNYTVRPRLSGNVGTGTYIRVNDLAGYGNYVFKHSKFSSVYTCYNVFVTTYLLLKYSLQIIV